MTQAEISDISPIARWDADGYVLFFGRPRR